MAKEIERKFLVVDNSFKSAAKGSHEISQAYISRQKEAVVRVRTKDDSAFITVKGVTRGFTRDEWEYQIPVSDAREMIARLAGGRSIEKTRYLVDYAGLTWEVDCFHGNLEGLCVAEVELPSPDVEVTLPPFTGREVTGDAAYYNSNLVEGIIPHEE